MVILPASLKTRLPSPKSDNFEAFPLTGWSRFAIQSTVGCLDFVNQIAKLKELSPISKKPAEKMPVMPILENSYNL